MAGDTAARRSRLDSESLAYIIISDGTLAGKRFPGRVVRVALRRLDTVEKR